MEKKDSVKFTIEIPKDLHRSLKLLAVSHGISMRTVVLITLEKVIAILEKTQKGTPHGTE